MRDLWNYPLNALTVKKLTLSFVFLVVGLGAYSALTYAAYYASGLDVSRVWNLHHLFPVPLWAKSFPVYVAERGGKFLLETDWSKFSALGKGVWFFGVLLLLWAYFMAPGRGGDPPDLRLPRPPRYTCWWGGPSS